MEKFEIEENDNDINTWIQTDANEYHGHIKIARIYHGDKHPSEVARLAKLLRAAPEMLEALQEMLKDLKDNINPYIEGLGGRPATLSVKALKDAIKKATP